MTHRLSLALTQLRLASPARTHERNETISRLDCPPNLQSTYLVQLMYMYTYAHIYIYDKTTLRVIRRLWGGEGEEKRDENSMGAACFILVGRPHMHLHDHT